MTGDIDAMLDRLGSAELEVAKIQFARQRDPAAVAGMPHFADLLNELAGRATDILAARKRANDAVADIWHAE